MFACDINQLQLAAFSRMLIKIIHHGLAENCSSSLWVPLEVLEEFLLGLKVSKAAACIIELQKCQQINCGDQVIQRDRLGHSIHVQCAGMHVLES